MLNGNSVFLTGPPGAGKTHVVKEFIRRAERDGKNVAVTASTGIAATHLGGTTIHSWSGLGIRNSLSKHDKTWLASNTRLIKRYNNTDVLVIDEISMLHGARLDMINQACKLLRKSQKPFGGLQIVIVGDLFQLPPVSRGEELADFAHMSDAWEELSPNICYLKEQHRQSGDGLLDVLEAMRANTLTNRHKQLLLARIDVSPDISQTITRLYAHNIDVDRINNNHLSKLPGEVTEYVMQISGRKAKTEQLQKSVLSPEYLELKVGAEVMFVVNNFAKGFANGTRGQVVEFDNDMPVVQLSSSKKKIVVSQHTWVLREDGKTRAEVTQLPLRLAWAITIHKSQGMSLDAAEIDLGKSFTPGMGYVALSRVRALDGVFLSGINRMALTLHPDIFSFDTLTKEESDALAEQTIDTKPEDTSKSAPASTVKPKLKLTPGQKLQLKQLKKWRQSRANKDSVPAFIVLHDSVLEAIILRHPTSLGELSVISGIGPKKLEAYGKDILKVL